MTFWFVDGGSGDIRPVVDEWYTSGEVARLLGVTDRTVANWARAGRLAFRTTVGGHRRFHRAEVERFVAQHDHRRDAGAIGTSGDQAR